MCVCVVNISHATVMRTLCIYSVGACRITEQTLEILSGEGGKNHSRLWAMTVLSEVLPYIELAFI